MTATHDLGASSPDAASASPSTRSHEPDGRYVHLLLLACGLCYFAQSYVAWGWPALDGYPAIERWLDPRFLTTDFYTNTTIKVGVDTWQAVLFGSIQRATGVAYEVQIAILGALRHLLWPWVLFGFLNALLRDRAAALLGVVFGVLANFLLPNMMGWSWLWGDGSPALFAIFLATWSWTCFLERRAWLGFGLLALGTIAQPLVAVHGGIVVAAIYLLDYDGREKLAALRSPLNWIGGAVFAAVFLWQYTTLATPVAARLPIAEYVNILAWERHPGDFLPSHFPLDRRRAFAISAFAVLLMLARLWPRLGRRPLIVGVLTIYTVICVAGYFFVEVWPIRFVVDLMPYRTVIIAAPLLLGIIAAFAASALAARLWITVGALMLAFILAGPYGLRFGVNPLIPALMLLAVAAVGRMHGAAPAKPLKDGLEGFFWRLTMVVLVALAAPAAIARREMMVLPTIENQHPLYAWVRSSTPKDSRFLVEQFGRYDAAVNPQKMRLVGRRAVVASKDFPFADSDYRGWLHTWVTALDHGAPERVEKADAAALEALCRETPYDYVVRVKPITSAPDFHLVATFPPAKGAGELHVYRACQAAPPPQPKA